MKKFTLFLAMALLLVTATMVKAESSSAGQDVQIDINEVALLRIVDGATDVAFTIDVADEATGGAEIEVITKENLTHYLQYTSIVATEDTTRKITVQLNSETKVPKGTVLSITPTAAAAGNENLKGILGTAVEAAVTWDEDETVSTKAKDVVTGIGSGYTGQDDADGAKIEYDLEIVDMEKLFKGTYTVKLLYTLTESE
jgi:hypothetical protein